MTDAAWVLMGVLAGLGLALAGGVAWWRARRLAASGLSPALLQRVRALAQSGQALEAIRLLRGRGGRGLKEATEVVESLTPPPREPPPEPGEIPPSPAVERLLRQRRFLEAVRAYQDQTGLDATQAREVMERLRNGIN
jgi:hypothetical protein